MKAVLPGQPESSLQALSTGCWGGQRIIVYTTGNALSILSDPDTILQTIYDDDERRLQAVTLDEHSGKIAACTDTTIRVYRPLDHGIGGSLQWALQASFDINDHAQTPATLSWGSSEELLVGRSSLWLYDTSSTPPSLHWQQHLASPARAAELSYDSSYIASVGYNDRLVKVWRRLNFGSEEVHFEFGYLPHPGTVTSIQWRKPFHVEQTIENILYTFCVDNYMRIWTGADGHGCLSLRLWGKLDLGASIPNDSDKNKLRYAFIISQRDLTTATEKAVQERNDSTGNEDVALQYMLSIANRDTEICVVMDGQGSLSVWALEKISNGTKSAKNIDNVAFTKSKEFQLAGLGPRNSHVEIWSYCDKKSGKLNILFHHFNGKVDVFESDLTKLFDPAPKPGRLLPRATWSGHSGSIKKIVRNVSGQSIVSRTERGESIVWRHANKSKKKLLMRQNTIPETRHIHRIAVIREGKFVIFLHHDTVSVWDCRAAEPIRLAECEYKVSGKPLCVLVLPPPDAHEASLVHIATVTSEHQGKVWELRLPADHNTGSHANGDGTLEPSIREFCSFELEDAGDLAYVLPVDPAGSSPVTSGFLDVFARDVAVSYTHGGRVEFWTARVNRERSQVEWLSTGSMETGVSEPSLASGSTMKKVAFVNKDRNEVSIWDVRGTRLEYSQDFESHNVIQDLDWTSTPDSQSILAVGFPYRVVLLAQLRFDYLNKGPAWTPIREINIRDYTPHPIGDSTWLSDGHLVIGAGNQLFIYDRAFGSATSLIKSSRSPHKRDGNRDLFDVVQRMNGPLAVFHPQFLSQCILAGKTKIVHRVLLALNHTLKYHVEGDVIDDYLGLDLAEFYTDNQTTATGTNGHTPGYLDDMSYEDAEDSFSEEVAVMVSEKLQAVKLPQLTGHEQIQLVDIIECAGLVEKHRRSMDENGARFMLFFRQHALRKGRTSEMHMSWREIVWAYHSTSQDILTDFVSRQYHGTMLWESARESGIFMWLSDKAAVKAQFEIVARNEYTKSELKNPVDCSIFYLALKKKTVLQGLWRMASWNREQKATQKLLANNFDNPKHKTTALKNAYALLSKRRFEYSAAFFLLAGHLQDAVNVCLNQIKDLQLAIAITRVYEDEESGPVLMNLLENQVLPLAAREGNRWLASWAFWMMKRKDMAVRALITPVYALVPETPASPNPDGSSNSNSSSNMTNKLFLTDDPALVVLYRQLREKTLQTLRGATKVTPRTEWEFVVHNARLYDRMGCDLLGLDLVRNWEFLLPQPLPPPPNMAATALNGADAVPDPKKLLRRRSSLVVADLPLHHKPSSSIMSPTHASNDDEAAHPDADQSQTAATTTTKVKPPPTMFEEPDAGDLLDSFGF